jgi:stress response protein SCP2
MEIAIAIAAPIAMIAITTTCYRDSNSSGIATAFTAVMRRRTTRMS